MVNIIKIKKLVNKITTYFNMVGAKKEVKNTFVSPIFTYSNPKDKKGLALDNNRYSLGIQNYKENPFDLGDNDYIITNGKNWIHLSFNEDTITINTTNKIVLNTDKYTNNSATSIDENTTTHTMNNTSLNINSSNSVTITTPTLNLNLDNFNINVIDFVVNASGSIQFNSPSFKHNGVNVGDTHTHFVKQIIFGGTISKAPDTTS